MQICRALSLKVRMWWSMVLRKKANRKKQKLLEGVFLNLSTAYFKAREVGIVHGADTLSKLFFLQAAWGSKPGSPGFCAIQELAGSPPPTPQQPLFRGCLGVVGVSLLSVPAATPSYRGCLFACCFRLRRRLANTGRLSVTQPRGPLQTSSCCSRRAKQTRALFTLPP